MQCGAEQIDRTGRSIGLGLYIVDAIVRAHAGNIDASGLCGSQRNPIGDPREHREKLEGIDRFGEVMIEATWLRR